MFGDINCTLLYVEAVWPLGDLAAMREWPLQYYQTYIPFGEAIMGIESYDIVGNNQEC